MKFRYERLGVFCYLCGMLGHTDQLCEQLFFLESDDGVRKWGPDIKAERRQGMGGGGNRWLRGEGGNNEGAARRVPTNQQRDFGESYANRNVSNGPINDGDSVANPQDKVSVKGKSIVVATGTHNLHVPMGLDTTTSSLAHYNMGLEKKRRRDGDGPSSEFQQPEDMHTTNYIDPPHHFLTVGPGPQACRDQ